MNFNFSASSPVRPRVVVNNPYIDVREGQRIEVQCAASGNPAPNFILQRADNQLLNPKVCSITYSKLYI